MVLTPGSEAEPATGPEGESEADVPPPVTGTGAPAAGEQPLILATPPVTPSGAAGERRVMSTRSLPGPWDQQVSGLDVSTPEAPALPVAARPPPSPAGPPVQRESADGTPASAVTAGSPPVIDPSRPDDDIVTAEAPAEPAPPGPVGSGRESGSSEERPASPGPQPAAGPAVVDLVGSAPLGSRLPASRPFRARRRRRRAG